MNVIHHDIKPENLLVDFQDNIKIADFGHTIRLAGDENDTVDCYDWGSRPFHPPEYFRSRRI